MNTLKLKFIIPRENYLNDVQDIVRGFFPYLQIDEDAEEYLKVDYVYSNSVFYLMISSSFSGEKSASFDVSSDDNSLYKKLTKRFIKNCIYDYLSNYFNVSLPYGSLTGVRPTKLYYEILGYHNEPESMLKSEFRVSSSRAELIGKAVKAQKGIYQPSLETADIYVNIPFCPTRCAYCSFISSEVKKVEKLLPKYAESTAREIDAIISILYKSNKKLKSVYIGGGTPTSIGVNNLEKILEPLSCLDVEFTVEAGRPDTLTEEMLDMLKRKNVTRLSVNPQSFNQKTLDKIGRKHSVDAVYEGFRIAREKGFIVNMDLIALLPEEDFEDFSYSLEKAIELRPDNITIHTLSIKRGAELSAIESERGLALGMTDYAYSRLEKEGYMPYYMYRQKNMADNLENVGFSIKGKECVYNIDMMEETNAVYGAGAGAMTKLFYLYGAIERVSNPKGIKEYLERIDTIIGNKNNLL